MSDPRPAKIEGELALVWKFLNGRGLTFNELMPGPDPPDVLVRREGYASLAIEVTSYHTKRERVAVEDRWRILRRKLDAKISQHQSLKGISIGLVFRDPKTPRAHFHGEICEEMVLCAIRVVKNKIVNLQNEDIIFSERTNIGSFDRIHPNWLSLSSRDWRELAHHISAISFRRIPSDGFISSNCYQAQTALCGPSGQAFQRILLDKEKKMRESVQQGKFERGGELWLLIESNCSNDIASFVFGSEHLKQALDHSGFNFDDSVFDQIWLMDQLGTGRSQRLFPWSESGE